jgi:hypothetical protein
MVPLPLDVANTDGLMGNVWPLTEMLCRFKL